MTSKTNPPPEIGTCKLLDKPLAERLRDEEVRYFGAEGLYSNETCNHSHRGYDENGNCVWCEVERLRAIISNIDGMLFDGADAKRIRAYLQREASTAPDSPREPPK